MEYQVEEITPVKRRVKVQVPAEEVNAALGTTAAFFRKDLKLDGFRKGKVPVSLVESKFKKDIQDQASRDLLNVHFNQILGEMQVEPLSGMDLDVGEMEKDQDLNYTFSFEILPEIDLPEYHGLSTTKNKATVQPQLVESALKRIQRENSQLVPVRDERQPQSGDVAVIDFQAFEGGEPLENIKADKFELSIGEGQSLQDFEKIVTQLLPGATGEGEVSFPEDFINPDLAGKTVTMQVTLNAIKERQLPDVDEDLADKVGGYTSVEEMKQKIEENFYNHFESMEKSAAQKRLLDQIISRIDVALPETLVTSQLDSMVENRKSKLEQQGKSLDSAGGEAALREELQSEAEEMVKGHIVLMAIAKKEDLNVTNQEVEQHLFRRAIMSGQDPQQLKKYYEENNMMFALRDSLLADRAMDLVYSNATIEEVDPGAEAQESSAAEDQTEAQSSDEDSAG